MGTLFEQLIRRLNEGINQNPGEHFTPKDVIRLLVRLVLTLDTELTSNPSATRTVAELPIRIRCAELNQRAPETPRLGCFHLDHADDKSLMLLTRFESDNDLKDFENVPLGTDIIDYFEREVLPHAPDAWINPDFADEKDRGVGKVENNTIDMPKEVKG